MKISSAILFLSLTSFSYFYAADKQNISDTNSIKSIEKFNKYFSQLTPELQGFVNDYKTWSLEEQQKMCMKLTIKTELNVDGSAYVKPILNITIAPNTSLIAKPQYNNNISKFLCSQLLQNDDLPFLFYMVTNSITKHNNNEYKVELTKGLKAQYHSQ